MVILGALILVGSTRFHVIEDAMHRDQSRNSNSNSADDATVAHEVDILVTLSDGRQYVVTLPGGRLLDPGVKAAVQALLKAAAAHHAS